MENLQDRIINMQMMLNAEIAREVEHGATKRDVYDAFAHTMTDKLKIPTSPSWVEKAANLAPRNLVNTSLGRFIAVETILREHIRIWD